MPWVPGPGNFFDPPTKGYTIYFLKRNARWAATKKYSDGRTKSGLFYSLDDAKDFLDNLPHLFPERDEDTVFFSRRNWVQN